MSSKAAKRQQSCVPNENKQVDHVRRKEEDEAELEKEESSCVSVTNQLSLKPIDNTRNLDKEVVLRRIRQRKRVNKIRSLVGYFLSSPFSTRNTDAAAGDGSFQPKRWVDDAFAAL